MPYQHLTVERKDHVATLTLNRPDAYNALNLGLGRDLFAASLELDEDPDVRCIGSLAPVARSARAAT